MFPYDFIYRFVWYVCIKISSISCWVGSYFLDAKSSETNVRWRYPNHYYSLTIITATVFRWEMTLNCDVIRQESSDINPLNAELNPICHLLALLAHHILHVSGLRVNFLCWHVYVLGGPLHAGILVRGDAWRHRIRNWYG